jgi:hypothetical protein
MMPLSKAPPGWVMDFEIRLYRSDGSLSLVVNTQATGARDARMQALRLILGDIVKATISSQGVVEHSFTRIENAEIANEEFGEIEERRPTNFVWEIGPHQ